MKSKKEQYRYRILKAYSILVDFDGEPHRERVPSPIEGETFKQWRLRILGDQATNVTIYGPWKPTPQMKMATVQEWSKELPLEKTFNAWNADQRQKVKEKTEEAVKRAYTSMPKDTLEDLINDPEFPPHPAVREFFEKFLAETSTDINTEELLRRVIYRFNENALSLGQAKQSARADSALPENP
jgi:hypothetical protein